MEIIDGSGAGLSWLWRTSWQATILILLVLLAQWAFRKRLSPKWRYALWLLVIGRLILPGSFESGLSIFNFARTDRLDEIRWRQTELPPVLPAVAPPTSGEIWSMKMDSSKNDSPSIGAPVFVTGETGLSSEATAKILRPNFPFSWKAVLFFAWISGVFFFGTRLVWGNWRFAKKLNRERAVDHGRGLEVLRECQEITGVRRSLCILETNQVESPALFGCFRLRLLLPHGMAAQFSDRELRYIFLHELAHIRRGDVLVNWLAALLQIFHWFNPLIWFGFHRMRADRELACDALALSFSSDDESKPYGETIIKLLESFSRATAVPGLVGILEDKKQMKERLTLIANFKKPSRWHLLALLLVFALGFVTLTDAQTKKSDSQKAPKISVVKGPLAEESKDATRPDLIGKVHSTNGEPISATVFISTAGPKVGTSSFCPSCYADCRKSAKSGGDGSFEIASLDPQLLFRILVVAKGYKPKFVDKVDPAKGLMDVKLTPSSFRDVPPENILRGRVVDADGKQIEGAVVESHGIRTKNGGGRWGSLPGVDPMAVTDEEGEFLIASKNPFESMDVKVEARTFANKTFTQLAGGTAAHKLVLTEGATIAGRVLLKGKPLPNVSVGIVSVDRGMENFTGYFEIGTTTNGQFAFVNLPPNVDYFVYGIMNTIKPYGAIGVTKVRSGKDGETSDVGDLMVSGAQRLAGRVDLADGKPVPSKTQLLVSRENAWDSMHIILDENGHFDTTGLPSETFSLSVRVPGYRISGQNPSLDPMNPFKLVGRVERDITNLVFLLEKGKDLESDYNYHVPDAERPQNRPLRGTEAGVDRSHQFAVSGRVLDAETKEPIPNAQLTPGQMAGASGPAWVSQQRQPSTNGEYLIYLGKTWNQPILKAEANGYFPAVSPAFLQSKTNFNFSLKKGSGPSGTVLLPGGTPAAKVSVALLCDGDSSLNLDDKGQISSWQNKKLITTTDANGKFSFAPELGMQSVVASGTEGFKGIAIDALAGGEKMVLEPWGKIRGVLQRPSGAGTNEGLDIAFAEESFPGQNQIRLSRHALTDGAGKFMFERVPPGKLQITYRVKQSNNYNSWQNENLEQVTLHPAQNLEIKINAVERKVAKEFPVPNQRPKPVRKPGVALNGGVLLPDGKPAVGAEIALLLPGEYLGLGRGTFNSSQAREDGLIVSADAKGEFELPSYDEAKWIVALNPEGYAKVSVESLKGSPKIILQRWGQVEGTLRIGKR
ncbi:MAG: M56 family metallopeptidase, partial [Verrucomicrobiota bacterium]